MSYTQDLFDRQISHLLSTKRYQESTRLLLERATKRHGGVLTRLFKEKLEVTREVTQQVQKHGSELATISKTAVGDYLGAEVDFQVNTLKRSADGWATVQAPNKAVVSQAITSSPLRLFDQARPKGTMDQLFSTMSGDELTRLQLKVRRGIADGTDTNTLIRQLVDTTKISTQHATTIVNTNFSQAESIVKERVLEQNSHLIRGLVFTAILDSRTSSICSSRDGLLQLVNEVKVRPPLHWNCRSTLVPVFRSKQELLESNSPFVNKARLVEVPDALLAGLLPAKEDFSVWLRRQPMDVKMTHLGSEERVAMLERGGLNVTDFFSSVGNPIELATLRLKDNIANFTGMFTTVARPVDTRLEAVHRPYQIIRSQAVQRELKTLLIQDASSANQSLSLTDYRGTTIGGKRGVRKATYNEYDPRNSTYDPFTGEIKSTYFYDPNFTLYRERLDFVEESKILDRNQKDFIRDFAESMEDSLSVNQRSAVVENLRVVFERYNRGLTPWEDFSRVVRSEMNFSVTNVSRLLDRRSRDRSQLFLGFKGDPNEPAVTIQGRSIPIAVLQRDKLDYKRYSDRWLALQGRAAARSLYYSGNASWKTYFFPKSPTPKGFMEESINSFKLRSIRSIFYKNRGIEFFTRYGKTPDKLSKIARKAIIKALTPTWYKDLSSLLEEGIGDYITRKVREFYRSIVDLEFLHDSKKRSVTERLFTKEAKALEGDAVDVLAKLLRVVAEGVTTDYDTLAINLGRSIKESWPDVFSIQGNSLQDFHIEGSKILESLKAQGKLRVNARGITRRATVDLDTGRAGGNWRDTVSREVEILDPNMLKLQDYNRRIEMATRLGIDRPENEVFVRPKVKTYFDARGNDTGVSIITRSAGPNFDKDFIDGDIADMLNHTMSLKYKVDDDFASFMDDLVRFKDPRGQTAYYDELNLFREEVVKRGDQGYGLMEAVRYYRSTGNPFSAVARIDGRGRVYYNGYLTPTGGELVRPFLNSAKSYAMTPEGVHQLRIQMSAILGPATEVLTDAGRLDVFFRNEKSILEVGALLASKTQRDRRIREFLTHPLVREIEGIEVAKIARFSLEYYRIYTHLKTNAKLSSYRSSLMGEADASASGLQVIALSTGNRGAALTSNVLPTTRKMRIYDLVAQDVVADPRFQKLQEQLGLSLTWEDLSKAAKYQVLVALYGAGVPGQTARVALELAKVLRKKDGIVVTTRAEYLKLSKQIDVKIKEAEGLGAVETKADLQSLKRELEELISNPNKAVAADILAEAEDIHPDVAELVRKYTGNYNARVGPEQFRVIAKLMSEKLAERAPVTQTYITFFKRLAQDYAKTTKKVRIPWVTYDNKVFWQDYRPKIQQEIRFYDPQSKRYVRNIYQMSAEDGKLLGKSQIGDTRLGFGVNGNHALDASLVRGYHLEGRRLGMDTSTIHDAIFQNINELPKGIDAMFRVYAKARDFNNIRATLDKLLAEGLPKDYYQRYLKEAEDLGFFSDGFSSDEILAPPKPGYHRYGFGP